MAAAPRGQDRASLSTLEVEERLRSFFQPEGPVGVVAVYLFGSTVSETPNREKDVDIAVLLDASVFPSKEGRSEAGVNLASGLIAALGTDGVDLVVLNDAPPELGRNVVQTGRRVVRTDPELDHAYVRDVQLRAADLDVFLRRTRAVKLRALTR
jgi:predicted nucleotidyltransferase